MNKQNHTFIVAELSANHGGSIDIVRQSILKAKEIGCDAVKIQTYTPDTMTIDCNNEYFKINTGSIWDGRTFYELYSKAQTPWEWHGELFDFAQKNDIVLFSTPFDKTAVDLLEECGNPIYKIASFEITDIPLIKYAASKGKPMVISTGIATETEIREAVDTCRMVGNDDICLLQCTSQYPAQPKDARLANMVDMQQRFGVETGLSDHSEDPIVSETAVAMGAMLIEKHFILDRSIGGPDASFSIEPNDFKKLIERIRQIERIKGNVSYELDEKKRTSRKYARSIFVVKDVKRGDVAGEANIRIIRPSDGLPPKYFDEIIGRAFKDNYSAGTPLEWSMME